MTLDTVAAAPTDGSEEQDALKAAVTKQLLAWSEAGRTGASGRVSLPGQETSSGAPGGVMGQRGGGGGRKWKGEWKGPQAQAQAQAQGGAGNGSGFSGRIRSAYSVGIGEKQAVAPAATRV